uniref:CRAL-TRIO domain-containing protein n=1 Tax=Chrysotila carterae TaxID=13221 RepID=A0A7S4B1R3_CHRCT|mmetsp:Transcript_16612/g.35671  ORF Transcript_16612/g.35671 Transcript_16612/m.35671 type:complete len:241 (-) Transcript_16612:500-1222(-)|eukprot:4784170-Pleurochrysis_carterae.AAC.8
MSVYFDPAAGEVNENIGNNSFSEWPKDATDAERKRFLNARNGDHEAAVGTLQAHLEWRKKTFPLAPGAPKLGNGLPNFVQFTPAVAKDGSRIVFVMAGMIELQLATSEEYALAIASLFEEQLDHSSTEKVTVVLDVRGGDGWPNPSATSLVPFIRVVAGVLSTNFPDRLRRLIVAPLPWVASALWSVVKQFLDPVTADKGVIINGSADRSSQLPEAVLEHLSDEALGVLNACRSAQVRQE